MHSKLVVGLTVDIIGIQQMFSFSKIIKFESNDLKRFGSSLSRAHRKQIDNGIDANGNVFKKYSASYRKRKAAGKYKNQVSKKVDPPNLKLTGKMMKSFDVIETSVKNEISIKYGITDSKQSQKMNDNNAKRLVADKQAVGPLVEKEIVKGFADQIGKNLSRMTDTTVVVNIG